MFGLDMVVELNLTLHAGKLYGTLHADWMSTFQYCITGLYNQVNHDVEQHPVSHLHTVWLSFCLI